MKKRDSHHQGLTTVELIVSITLSAFFILGLIPLLLSFFSSLQDSIGRSKQIGEIHSAVQTINNDLLRARALLRLSDMDDNENATEHLRWNRDKNVWSFTGKNADSRTLILRLPSTRGNINQPNRRLSLMGSCRGFNEGSISHYNIIYFVHNNILYRRTLLFRDGFTQIPGLKEDEQGNDTFRNQTMCRDTSASQKQTCIAKDTTGRCTDYKYTLTPGYTEPEKDVPIVSNITKFSIEYFKHPIETSTTDYYTNFLNNTSSTDDIRRFPDIPDNPKDIQLSITTKIRKSNNTYSTIRLTTRGALPW